MDIRAVWGQGWITVAALSVAVASGVVACSSEVSPSPSTPAAGITPSPPVQPVGPVVGLFPMDWNVTFRPRDDGLIVQDIDQGRVLYDHWGPVDGTTELVRVEPGMAPEGTTLSVDRRIQQAQFLGSDVVYSVTSDADPALFEILWWPAHGASPVVVWDAAAQGSRYSELVVQEESMYFVCDANGAMCLTEAGVADGDLVVRQDVGCANAGEVLWWLRAGDDRSVSFLVALLPPRQRCGRLHQASVRETRLIGLRSSYTRSSTITPSSEAEALRAPRFHVVGRSTGRWSQRSTPRLRSGGGLPRMEPRQCSGPLATVRGGTSTPCRDPSAWMGRPDSTESTRAATSQSTS